MLDILGCAAMVVFYLLLFLAFGSFVTRWTGAETFSVTLTVLVGYFLYFGIFQILAVPMALLGQPLSVLSAIWCVCLGAVILSSAVCNRKLWRTAFIRIAGGLRHHFYLWVPVAVVLLQIFISLIWQTDFWDNAYYIGDVSMSVYTNTIGAYDPLAGHLRETYDIRHFFAMYHMQDAVICQVFGIHPLIETKTVMGAVVAILSNMVCYKLARLLLHGYKAAAIMVSLAFLINLFSYSAYSTSGFLLLRSYEGKTILGNIIIPGMIYFMARIYLDHKSRLNWMYLFILGYASIALSSSAMMLIPVGMTAFGIPLLVMKKDWRILWKGGVCMVPCLLVALCYLLSRAGLLIIHI